VIKRLFWALEKTGEKKFNFFYQMQRSRIWSKDAEIHHKTSILVDSLSILDSSYHSFKFSGFSSFGFECLSNGLADIV
jgi:hypothetical protein